MTYWIKVMYIEELRSLQAAIIEQTVTATGSDWQWTSEVPFRVSVAFSRVERGDTKGLSTWMQLNDENIIAESIHEQYLIARGC